jgi:hypothetical protein
MLRFERAELLKKCRAMAARGLSAKGRQAAASCRIFYGAASMERIPVRPALTEQVRKFKAIGGR